MPIFVRGVVGLLAALVAAVPVAAANPPEWSKPFPAYKIAGNIYYVGTADLACFLVTGSSGHILINTGMVDSVPLIQQGVEKLGFKMKDIKVLLTMQAHYDHVAGFAAIQKMTGAKVYATVADAAALEDGGKSDPYLKAAEYRFEPVKVDRRLKDSDEVKLGSLRLKVVLMQGHTKGSTGYSTTVMENGKEVPFLFANMGSVVMPLVGNPEYPEIAKDLERCFEKQRALKPVIWVAGHASQYDMEAKQKAGSFVDPDGYQKAVERYAKLFRQQLAIQTAK